MGSLWGVYHIILLLCKWVESFVTFGKIHYFIEPPKCSNLYIDSYIFLYIYACIKSLLKYVSDIDSYHVGFLLYWGPMYVGS